MQFSVPQNVFLSHNQPSCEAGGLFSSLARRLIMVQKRILRNRKLHFEAFLLKTLLLVRSLCRLPQKALLKVAFLTLLPSTRKPGIANPKPKM